MCCSLKLTKFFFVLVDILFLLMGFAMVGIGAWVQLNQADFLGVLVDSKYVSVPLVMIAAGTIVIIVSIIGLIGACMQQKCCLIMFVVCVLFVFIMELAVGIIAFLHRNEIESTLKEELLEGMKNDLSLPSWDVIQNKLKCCGVNNASDWLIGDKTTIPDSCCRFSGCGLQGIKIAHRDACFTKVKTEIKDNFYYLGAAGIGLGVCQIIAIISGISLLVMLWRNDKVV
ncbi:tetraspanin-9-like [Haliotis rubra]|uniref:tetraspanin-9-like n=1 Tax=Haliotis rubra TaxID=36100 RepID=UPI001EE5B781|nr:tetraspanin-9-like [Haliotis rubra]